MCRHPHVSPRKQDEQLSLAAPPGALLVLGKLEGSRCRGATGTIGVEGVQTRCGMQAPAAELSRLPAQARSRPPGPADSAPMRPCHAFPACPVPEQPPCHAGGCRASREGVLGRSTDGAAVSPLLAGERHAGFVQDAAPNPAPVPYCMLEGVLLASPWHSAPPGPGSRPGGV